MADYKENILKSKQRARSVFISNILNEVPTITFEEEIVTTEGTKLILAVPQGALLESFSVPTESFNLINPETGDTIGSATYMDAYVLLHSIYRHVATKRDAEV